MKDVLGRLSLPILAGLIDPELPLVAKPLLEQAPEGTPRQMGLWEGTALPKLRRPRRKRKKTAQPVDPKKTAPQPTLKGVFRRGAIRGRARPKGQFDDSATGLQWRDEDLQVLAAAILEDSLGVLRKEASDEERRQEEILWVCSLDVAGFSFENVCRLQGLNPSEMREVILTECKFRQGIEMETVLAEQLLKHCIQVLRPPRKAADGDPNDNGPSPELIWEMLDWISSRSKERFSFEDCCDFTDQDAEALRTQLIASCKFLAP